MFSCFLLFLLLQKSDRVDELKEWVERHKFHVQKLEVSGQSPSLDRFSTRVAVTMYNILIGRAEHEHTFWNLACQQEPYSYVVYVVHT